MINWAAIYVRSEYQNNHQPGTGQEPCYSSSSNERRCSFGREHEDSSKAFQELPALIFEKEKGILVIILVTISNTQYPVRLFKCL